MRMRITMKRLRSNAPSCSSGKRHKLQCADARSPRASSSALTEESLSILQQSFSFHQQPEMAAPRSATNRGRRNLRRDGRSQGSRTPSPSKPTPQTYRTRNMYLADVRVEALRKLPSDVDELVRQMLGIESWEDDVTVPEDESSHRKDAAAWYLAESQNNARDCSLEGDWKSNLQGLIKMLSNPFTDELKVNGSEKIWNSDLKPMGSHVADFPVEDDDGRQTPGTVQTDLPIFDPNAATAAAFSGPVPSLRPYTPSTSTEAAGPYHISTPKPDITVGLADGGFEKQHESYLIKHQASGSILSDPHTAEMALRFPFLVVEAKGLSLNGSLVSAQNQAAISGASSLAILHDLHNQVNGYATAAADSRPIPLCFSIVTSGPTHELSVHFMHNNAFHMYCFQSYRTTLERHAWEFVAVLIRILKWGMGRYKDGIVELLDRATRR
ncbi:hypothetical protein GQ44DRAFT_720241, partial [Phaeosphaeriaceae sp. PMI808]